MAFDRHSVTRKTPRFIRARAAANLGEPTPQDEESPRSANEAALAEAAHQRQRAFGPGLDRIARIPAIGERSKARRGDAHHVAHHVREALAGPCLSCVGANIVPRNSMKP